MDRVGEFSSLLKAEDVKGLRSIIGRLAGQGEKASTDSLQWTETIDDLNSAIRLTLGKYWLKKNELLLSVFGCPDLLGVDTSVIGVLNPLHEMSSLEQICREVRHALQEHAQNQLQCGGSTLFFSIDRMASADSATLIPDLIQARYRETLLVLEETDRLLPELQKGWVDTSRLWRTSNGFRVLKSRNHGLFIEIKEYERIRDLLLQELGVQPDALSTECKRLRSEGTRNYLQLTEELENFTAFLVTSFGVRGNFDSYYKSAIDYGGLDEF